MELRSGVVESLGWEWWNPTDGSGPGSASAADRRVWNLLRLMNFIASGFGLGRGILHNSAGRPKHRAQDLYEVVWLGWPEPTVGLSIKIPLTNSERGRPGDTETRDARLIKSSFPRALGTQEESRHGAVGPVD
jgi:hypothetical protein